MRPLIAKLPPVEIKVSVVCTIVKIPAFYRLRHIDVQAEEQNPSPVKEEWMNPYLVNCLTIFSTIHARQLPIEIRHFLNPFMSASTTCCSAEIRNMISCNTRAMATSRLPMATVPRLSNERATALHSEQLGPARSCLPSWN